MGVDEFRRLWYVNIHPQWMSVQFLHRESMDPNRDPGVLGRT